ncbi:MAG: hypothetical protein LBP20_03950 [Treponema sp.]|nr:hypothetical protein [Treponema sp.]
MKRLLCACAVISLVLAGCGQLTGPVGGGEREGFIDPALPPVPEGQIRLAVPAPLPPLPPLPSNKQPRTLAGTSADVIGSIDYYEVYFYKEVIAAEPEYFFTGTAGRDEFIYVNVVPDVTYKVLLLAGDKKTKTLLASAYDGSVTIERGEANQVNLQLKYVKSGPDDFSFNYEDIASGGLIANAIIGDGDPDTSGEANFEVSSVAVAAAGSGYAKGNLISAKLGDTNAPTLYLKVTEVSDTGGIVGTEIVQKCWWTSAATISNRVVTTITGTGSAAQLTITTAASVDIPTNVPWITYAVTGPALTRTEDLKFTITTRELTPLINAQGGALTLKKAVLTLRSLDTDGYDYPHFNALTSEISTTTDFTSATILTADSIALTYSFPAADVPSITQKTYGTLYYVLHYYPFGSKGAPWTIRNGIDTKAIDQSTPSGSGILVKIGAPGEFKSQKTVEAGVGTGG